MNASVDLSGLRDFIRVAAEVLAAVAAVSGIGLWILHSMRLAANASKPQARAEAVDSLGQVFIGMIIIFSAVTVAGFVAWLVGRA